jgi:opacity protein-like surface antigen
VIRRCCAVIFLMTGIAAVVQSQSLFITLKGSYTTSARFLYDDIGVETKYLSTNFGYGLDIRGPVLDEYVLAGCSGEVITAVDRSNYFVRSGGTYLAVPVEDGYRFSLYELSVYFIFPFSSEDIRAYAGGGLGYYRGERRYSMASVTALMRNRPYGYGIHVLTGTEIRLWSHLFVRGELKFRDPQIDAQTSFDKAATEYQGAVIRLPEEISETRINLNGIAYTVGIAVTF